MDILREFEAIAKSAWEDREADEILDAIESALRDKYTRQYSDLVALEICYEDMAGFRLPCSNNEIYVVQTCATFGDGMPRIDHTDAFLVTSYGVSILEGAEIGEDEE